MPFVVNLYGPNTHGLARMVSSVLEDRGISCSVVESQRRLAQLEQQRNPDGVHPFIDGSLGGCVACDRAQQFAMASALDEGRDVVLNCGGGPDAFFAYKGDIHVGEAAEAVKAAVERFPADAEFLPRGGLSAHTLATWRSFLIDCGSAPASQVRHEYGCEEIVALVAQQISQQRLDLGFDAGREPNIKVKERFDMAQGFKRPAIHANEVLEQLPEGSELRRQVENAVRQAREDGYGGIRYETLRDGRSASISNVLQGVHIPRPDEVAVEQVGNVFDKEENTMAEKEQTQASAEQQAEKSKPEYTKIKFESEDWKIGFRKNQQGEKYPARVNCTLPKGTVVNGQDLSGAKLSVGYAPWMQNAKNNGQALNAGSRSDQDANVFRVHRVDGKTSFESIKGISMADLKAAVEEAYQNPPSQDVATVRHEFIKITFADENTRIAYKKDEQGNRTDTPNHLNCTMPEGTVVDGRDISGFKMSRPIHDKDIQAKQNHEPITVNLRADLDAPVFTFGEDGKFQKVEGIKPGELSEAVEVAYEADKELAAEDGRENQEHSESLDEMMGAKNDEASLVDGTGEPDLYEQDQEW